MEWVKEALQGFKDGWRDSQSAERPRSRIKDWALLVALLAGMLVVLALK